MYFYTFDKDCYHLHIKMQEWCVEQFGPGQWIGEPYPKEWQGLPNWTIHIMFGRTTFAFKNKQDLTWFKLRWA